MIERLFLRHPRSIGESYGEHFTTAGGFGLQLISGGVACLVHALVPAWFEHSASNTVHRLHDFMMARRARGAAEPHGLDDGNWVLDFQI